MLFSVKQLIKGQTVVRATLGMTFREALGLMVANEFSQLPVVDEAGIYRGMLSEHSIVEHLVNGKHKAEVLEGTVDRWYAELPAVSPDTKVYQLLDRLNDRKHSDYAVAVTNAQGQPTGVVTHYDLARFCGTYAYAFMLIEDIERTLRGYIEVAFPDERERDAIAERVASQPADPSTNGKTFRPTRYRDYSLANYLEFITCRTCWKEFEGYFGTKRLFSNAMDDIPGIRNDAMHFREGKLDDGQVRVLERATEYLRKCERQHPPADAVHVAPTPERSDQEGQ